GELRVAANEVLHHPWKAKADWLTAGGGRRRRRLVVVLSDLVTLPDDGPLDGGREFGLIPPALTCGPRRWVVAGRHGLLGPWRLRLEGLGDLGAIPYDDALHRPGELDPVLASGSSGGIQQGQQTPGSVEA